MENDRIIIVPSTRTSFSSSTSLTLALSSPPSPSSSSSSSPPSPISASSFPSLTPKLSQKTNLIDLFDKPRHNLVLEYWIRVINIYIPNVLCNIIYNYSPKGFGNGKDGPLIVENNEVKILKSDYHYNFSSILIKANGVITVNPWDYTTKSGGRLFISVLNDIFIDINGGITVSGLGYNGGKDGEPGESYNGKRIVFKNRNNEGGGGTGCGNLCLGPGGGGGYGTRGEDGENQIGIYGNGGDIYGDKDLNILHLGSGGGSSRLLNGSYGGNGGGAIQIFSPTFTNYGKIVANGKIGNLYGGHGSGGSIYIKCYSFNNYGNIQAIGGSNSIYGGGSGGFGRIRVDFDYNGSFEAGTIQPPIGSTSNMCIEQE